MNAPYIPVALFPFFMCVYEFSIDLKQNRKVETTIPHDYHQRLLLIPTLVYNRVRYTLKSADSSDFYQIEKNMVNSFARAETLKKMEHFFAGRSLV